ncbi:Serpentine Receptor, class H [Caenorhabditis elegans]|uniref:Serpentine Receptor, class H n=1 Tax=Caenorhabditis elegans TaxID=6239 RepID=O16433_CAEEL|nr:Serpentine Receptor, class H [Caenorhabditis elegans]CCD62584.1 Serpentine Receptor, class H [Caenorhabditis elegans]|eukprot:NP_504325.1 Serpentine Receptor, class H [Caenorhabditis elegans]
MDCLEPPPATFRILSHSIHFISIPIYCLALYSLIFIKSNVFTTYRIFLIWHVSENIFFEMYSAFFLAPALHAPFVVMRTTGILSHFGINSLVQFYILTFSIECSAVCISEMFYFRYKASLVSYKDHYFTYFLRFLVYSTRCFAIFDFIFPIVTYQDANKFQQIHKLALLQQNPSAQFLRCDSVYLLSAFADYVSIIVLSFWIVQFVVLCVAIPGAIVYITLNIPKSTSETTWKVQQQLLKSLAIQALIHAIMLGGPNSLFILALFLGYNSEELAYSAFLSLIYHGFISTFAMIVFTKPVRHHILECLKLRKTFETKGNSLKKSNQGTVTT